MLPSGRSAGKGDPFVAHLDERGVRPGLVNWIFFRSRSGKSAKAVRSLFGVQQHGPVWGNCRPSMLATVFSPARTASAVG